MAQVKGDPGPARKVLACPSGTWPESWRICVHEAGHALVSVYLGFGVGEVSLFVPTPELFTLNHVAMRRVGGRPRALALAAAAGAAAEYLTGEEPQPPSSGDLALFATSGLPETRFTQIAQSLAAFFSFEDVAGQMRDVAAAFLPRFGTAFECAPVIVGLPWVGALLDRARAADLGGQNGLSGLEVAVGDDALGYLAAMVGEALPAPQSDAEPTLG